MLYIRIVLTHASSMHHADTAPLNLQGYLSLPLAASYIIPQMKSSDFVEL